METFINLSLCVSFSFLMICWGFKHLGCFIMSKFSIGQSEKELSHRIRMDLEDTKQ